MNIDQKIKQALEQETSDVDRILAEEKGITDFVLGSFRSSLKTWFVLVNIITLLMTAVLMWTAFEFFTAEIAQEQSYWGICFLASLLGQIALKQWIWAEMSRSSLMREIKRVEWSLSRMLTQQQTNTDEKI